MLRSCVIDGNLAEQRADRLVKKLCPELGLSRIHNLFRKKEIKELNNGKKKVLSRGSILKEGSTLYVYGLKKALLDHEENIKKDIEKTSHGNSLPIPIVLENKDLLVLNKPDTLCVHPGTGVPVGRSIIEQVHHYLGVKQHELFKPSLVHRLDKETSGVLLIAKSGAALKYWTELLRNRKLVKRYWVLVDGKPFKETGIIETDLTRIDSKEGGAKSLVNDIRADQEDFKYSKKPSITKYRILSSLQGTSLLEVDIETGRMHQIRAHMMYLGTPVIGDSRYGDFDRNKYYKKVFGIQKLFLHARSLRLKEGGSNVLFSANLSQKRQEILESMGYVL